MLIATTSISGSPGVSAWSLLLTSAWPGDDPRNRVLVEADTSGGVLAIRYGLSSTPGIVELISNVRQGVVLRETLEASGHRLGEKLWAVPSPGNADVAWPILYRMGALGSALSGGDDIWFVDCGRWWPTSPSVSVTSEADLNLIFVDAEDSALLSVRNRVHHFKQFSAVGVVVVGSTQRTLEELEANFSADKVWMIPTAKQLDLVAGQAATAVKKVRRSKAWRQALDLSSDIHGMLQGGTAPQASLPEADGSELSGLGHAGPSPVHIPATQAPVQPQVAVQVPASTPVPVQPQAPASTPVPVQVPASTPVPVQPQVAAQAPASTPVPAQPQVATPVPVQASASTPVPVQAPASTPVPAQPQVAAQAPIPAQAPVPVQPQVAAQAPTSTPVPAQPHAPAVAQSPAAVQPQVPSGQPTTMPPNDPVITRKPELVSVDTKDLSTPEQSSPSPSPSGRARINANGSNSPTSENTEQSQGNDAPRSLADDSPTFIAPGPGLPPANFSNPSTPSTSSEDKQGATPEAKNGLSPASGGVARSAPDQNEVAQNPYYHEAPTMRRTFKSTMSSVYGQTANGSSSTVSDEEPDGSKSEEHGS